MLNNVAISQIPVPYSIDFPSVSRVVSRIQEVQEVDVIKWHGNVLSRSANHSGDNQQDKRNNEVCGGVFIEVVLSHVSIQGEHGSLRTFRVRANQLRCNFTL
jgi:hypothetical protein